MKKISIITLIMLSIVLTGMTTVYAKVEKSIDIRCKFFYTHFYSVINDEPEMGIMEKFEFVIKGVDKEYPLLVGNIGTSKLIRLPSNASETIYLIELTPSENINYITIFPLTKHIVFIKGYGHMDNMWSQTSIGVFKIIK